MSTSDPPTESQVSQAVALMRCSQDQDDQSLFRDLVRTGIRRELAARLVEFLPMAYCRVLFAGSGVQFSDSVQRASQSIVLHSNPTWQAAFEFARTEVARGIDRAELLAIARRSAEFQAINNLLNQGSKLADVRLTAAFLLWPDAGPHDNE